VKGVRDAHHLCQRASGDLQGSCRRDDVAALGRLRDRLELRGDRGLGELTQAIGRRRGRWADRCHLAQLGTDRCDGEAEAVNPDGVARAILSIASGEEHRETTVLGLTAKGLEAI
jgi:hypothetical protein